MTMLTAILLSFTCGVAMGAISTAMLVRDNYVPFGGKDHNEDDEK